jgi:3-oxoacyl-[acyl-carrier protein] reductase
MMTKIDLCGRRALVIGGASGIGEACSMILDQAGAGVIVADINLEGAEQTAAKLGEGCAFYCDIGDPESIFSLVTNVESSVGNVDILVNCAGVISYLAGIKSVELAEWDKIVDINLRGAFLLCRELVEGMKDRGYGKIIFFSSLAARVGGIEVGCHYAATKAGLIGLVRTLAKETAPYGITVNAVAPGIIATDPVKQQISGHEDEYIRSIPLGRIGEPEDVAGAVLFLCSPLSDYITGIVLDINGGLYMG